MKWRKPPRIFILIFLVVLTGVLVFKWLAYNPKVDYCYVKRADDVLTLFGHRPWAEDRSLMRLADGKSIVELITTSVNVYHCPFELR